MLNLYSSLSIILLACSIAVGCKNDSDFAGNTAAKKASKTIENANQNDDDANPDGGDAGLNDDHDSGGSGNLGDDNSDGSKLPETVDECIEYKAKVYNLVLVFDNSGSQKDTDPTFVRRTAAVNFVNTFKDFQKGKKTAVNMASVSFSDLAIRGQWHNLENSSADIISDIEKHTQNPNGRTNYSPPLDAASALFNQKSGEKYSKNYVVFLTDGAPTASTGQNGGIGSIFTETMSGIERSRNRLINNHNASILSIAAGQQIEAGGEEIVKKLSDLPSTKSSNFQEKKYEGQYFRAQNGDELNKVWQSLFEKIGTCD